MMLDLKVTNATIVDGSGAPAFAGAIGIADGRIVAVGIVPGEARQEIDAGGAVVAPGFIDCHTHYDAQALWDPMLSPSVYHGVTTVISGHCGFTLAPLSDRAEDHDYLLAMLARVEGMPLPSLVSAVKPTWRSFGEYLGALDGRLAINTVFLVGHCALRRQVMGDRAVGQAATAEDIAAMCDLLRRSLAEGGAGFSTSISHTHSDHEGNPVPSRFASDEELLALARVVGEFEGTWLEMAPVAGRGIGARECEVTTAMSLAAGRALNWNVIITDSARPEMLEAQLEIGRHAARNGAKVYGLAAAAPMRNVLNFRTGIQLELLDGWLDFINLPEDRKLAAMRDPAVRETLRQGMEASHRKGGLPAQFDDFLIEVVGSERNARWQGRCVRDYAGELGRSAFDALFDLAIEEQLNLSFSPPLAGADDASWRMRRDVWRDENCLIGGSDAGAHVDSIDTFALPTHLLGEGVRRRGLIPLEEAVHRITALPAEVFGLRDRGRIAVGNWADLVVFDADEIGCGPVSLRNDLPQGEIRLYAESRGIRHVIVNGVPVATDNAPTGALGGKVLRSGVDTVSVSLADHRDRSGLQGQLTP